MDTLLLNFDTASFRRLLADSLKITFKSMNYNGMVTEWE